VYTAKLLYAVRDLLERGYFPPDARIAVLMSGAAPFAGNGT
jgi:hypothetical protein